jgi:hypothetical protein
MSHANGASSNGAAAQVTVDNWCANTTHDTAETTQQRASGTCIGVHNGLCICLGPCSGWDCLMFAWKSSPAHRARLSLVLAPLFLCLSFPMLACVQDRRTAGTPDDRKVPAAVPAARRNADRTGGAVEQGGQSRARALSSSLYASSPLTQQQSNAIHRRMEAVSRAGMCAHPYMALLAADWVVTLLTCCHLSPLFPLVCFALLFFFFRMLTSPCRPPRRCTPLGLS